MGNHVSTTSDYPDGIDDTAFAEKVDDALEARAWFARVRVVDATGLGNSAGDTVYEAGDSVDGVTLAQGDLVLRAASNDTHRNGIYVVPASGEAQRHANFNAYNNLAGLYIAVMEGTTYTDTLWRCTSNKGGTLGVTALTFAQFTSGSSGREVLTANRTYYVRTDGSDSNDGLTDSAGGAFLTIQKAINTAVGLDLSTFSVTIQIGGSGVRTFTGSNTLKSYIGTGPINIIGDTTTPSNCVISTTSASCFTMTGVSGTWTVRGFKLQTTTSGHCFSITDAPSILDFYNIEFGACAQRHILLSGFCRVKAQTGYTINGNAQSHIFMNEGAYLHTANNLTVTLSGTPAFSSEYVNAALGALYNAKNMTFSGSATGTRFTIASGAIVDTGGGGASYFPGNAAGSGDPGTYDQYI